MANEFVARNGIIALKDSVVSGSLTVTGDIIGTIPTASHALTASSADNLTVRGTITAETLVVQTITSSVSWITGSTEFGSIITNTHEFTGSVNISGSLSVNNDSVIVSNQTSSMTVLSASYALTASYALNAGGASASGDKITSGSITASVDVTTATFRIDSGSSTFLYVSSSGNLGLGTTFPTTKLHISSSAEAAYLRGSGSGVFAIDGNSGRLFSVDDSLSGSLFSVNTIAGLPVIEAFSDNTVRIGQYGQKGLFVSQSSVGVGTETPQFKLDVTGSARFVGLVQITGSIDISNGVTGSLLGTASYAISSSNAITASYAITSSYAITASYALNGGGGGTTTIIPTTLTSSFVTSSNDIEQRILVDCSTNSFFIWTASFASVNYGFTSSYITASTNDFGSSTSGVVTLPSGGLQGDVYLLAIGSDGGTAPSLPAGWVSIDNTTGGVEYTRTAYYIQTSSVVPSNPTVTGISIATCAISMILRNVTHNNVTASFATSVATGASGMPNPPAVTVSNPNSLVVVLGYLDDDNVSVTAPTGFTLAAQQAASTTGQTIMAATLVTGSSTVDPSAFGGAGTDDWVALSLAFPPSGSIVRPVSVAFTNFPTPTNRAYEMTHLVNVKDNDSINWSSFLNSNSVTWPENKTPRIVSGSNYIFKLLTTDTGSSIYGEIVSNDPSSYVNFNRQTSDYTLTLSDVNEIVEMNSPSANTVIVPSSTVTSFLTGSQITVVQYGAGQTTITTGSADVVLRSANNWVKINARYGAVTLTKIGGDEWYLFGNLNA